MFKMCFTNINIHCMYKNPTNNSADSIEINFLNYNSFSLLLTCD